MIVKLKTTGSGQGGTEVLTTTDNVSSSGFTCSCSATWKEETVVEVFLKSPEERQVGRARIVRVEWLDRYWKRHSFRFVEKTRGWVPGAEQEKT